jgi:cell division protein FtsQ
MRRIRGNRRKRTPLRLPKLPAFRFPRIRIDLVRVLGYGAAALMALGIWSLGQNLLELPVQRLEIAGSFQRVTKLEIEAAASPAIAGSFVSVDLDEVRRLVETIDWVDSVSIERDWPGTIRIAYTEHRAAARWGESGLLDTGGELFAQDAGPEYSELPRLDGPAHSHRRVAARYLDVRDRLTRAGLALDVLSMDARGAFTIGLIGGIKVRIGRDDIDGRIDRFFAVAVPALAADIERAQYVDMRYPSGFAVGWRAAEPVVAELARLDSGG